MRDSYVFYSDKLQGEYKEAFRQIEQYVNTQNVDEDTVEAHMGELLDTFLTAQQEGRPVSKIVGNDPESFCRNFCSEFTWENKALNIVERWRNIAWFIFVLEGLDVLLLLLGVFIDGDPISNLWNTESTLNVTGYLLGFLIVYLIYTGMDYVSSKILFKLKKGSLAQKLWTVAKVAVLIGCFFIIFLMMGNEALNLLVVPSWVLAAVAALYLIIYYTVNHRRIKERKANKVSFWKMVEAEAAVDFPSEFEKQMQKQYEKKNKKLAKKGKPAMSWKEFVDAREKELQKTLKTKVLFDWGPLIIALFLGFLEYLSNGFSADLILYIALLFVCELVCLQLVWKLVSSALKSNLTWVETQRRRMTEEEK